MDPALITPFIASIKNVFSTMLKLDVKIGEPRIKSDPCPSYDVSGIIGISGDVVGSVVFSLPLPVAAATASRFLNSTISVDSPDLSDAIGEIVNMITGSAKSMFGGSRRASISCPSVVVGKNHMIAPNKDMPTVVIPFTTECGELTIEVSIRDAVKAKAAA
jgi:chemotaxis protein CheX